MRPPVPPFTEKTARTKVQAAEDAWNSRDPEKVSLAYTPDTEWRNRDEFLNGRDSVKSFLTHKWANELDYKLKKELWAFTDNGTTRTASGSEATAMKCGNLPMTV